MTFLELAKARYSVRKFDSRPIEDEKLDAIIEAGRIAPTACNFQPQHVYVVKSAEALAKVNAASPCIYGAPVVLVVCYDTATQAGDFGRMDASIVCTHMMLEAWEQGIGSCWVGMFKAEELTASLGLPENIVPAALLPIGYAADGVAPHEFHTTYRPYEETVTVL